MKRGGGGGEREMKCVRKSSTSDKVVVHVGSCKCEVCLLITKILLYDYDLIEGREGETGRVRLE